MSIRTLVVVPTLGQRPDFLAQSLASIRAAGVSRILLVGPASFDASEIVAAGLADEKVDEAARGLAAAINQGFAAAGPGIDYLAWLGDDDLLRADGYVLGTTANFGYMSGAMKHVFDSTFLQIGGALDASGATGLTLSSVTIAWGEAGLAAGARVR